MGGGEWGAAVHTGGEPSQTENNINNNYSCATGAIRPVCQSTGVAASASAAPVIIQDIVFHRQRSPKLGGSRAECTTAEADLDAQSRWLKGKD